MQFPLQQLSILNAIAPEEFNKIIRGKFILTLERVNLYIGSFRKPLPFVTFEIHKTF
jgi:hypothetical protein